MKKKIVVVSIICATVIFVATSVTYVHRGYVGVIESGESLRLLGHGPHLKVPGDHVTFYPVRYQQVHLQVSDEDLRGTVDLDMILLVSVLPDSIPHLHRTYHGAFVERLLSPLIVDYLRLRGSASEAWIDGIGSEDETAGIVKHLHSTAAPHGVHINQAWIRSYEVVTSSDDPSMSLP